MTGYVMTFPGKGSFAPEGKVAMTPEEAERHNAELEAQQLREWKAQPEHFAGYVSDDDTVTTWRGTVIGTIERRSKYSTNLSRNMVALTVRGTNGAKYHARYGADWSQLVRLRKCRDKHAGGHHAA